MARSQRPGGLTALGLTHFLMAAVQGLGVLTATLGAAMNSGEIDKTYGSMTNYIVLHVGSAALTLVLLMNGIGFMRTSRFMGRTLSLAFFALSVAVAAGTIILAPRAFSMSSVAALAYAVMATGLVWTVFRRDFDSVEMTQS